MPPKREAFLSRLIHEKQKGPPRPLWRCETAEGLVGDLNVAPATEGSSVQPPWPASLPAWAWSGKAGGLTLPPQPARPHPPSTHTLLVGLRCESRFYFGFEAMAK